MESTITEKNEEELKNSKWIDQVIKQDEIDRYLHNGKDFIDEQKILRQLKENKNPDKLKIRSIIQKSLSIIRLEPEETAALLNVTDPELLEEMFVAADQVKHKVYDNRIVSFAPLYCSNYCVNNCAYCGFRKDNPEEKRRRLSMEEIKEETKALVKLGHKRLISVYGEHPLSDARYIADSIRAIYEVEEKTRRGKGNIRRVNINAAPLDIADFKMLHEVGIGTYQIFQETYHKETYKRVHPSGIKANYRWRLYGLHRAMEAGVDDVAIGALFGLYDWRFEVMGLLYHAMDLEQSFDGIGPHTVSFPRLNAATGTDLPENSLNLVSDDELKRVIAILRLSIPYTGVILTAREKPALRKDLMRLGVTQTDSSTRIGIGAYSEGNDKQKLEEQQFMIGDSRSLGEVIKEYADMGIITSFCTAGYRCGRTGDKIMNLLKSGTEGKFCKLNAVLTYREWLDDFADAETLAAGEKVIKKELAEIEADPYYKNNNLKSLFYEYLVRVKKGERDLYI